MPELIRERLANFAIVLNRPKYPENIGAAARIAMNMGISRLIVISDQPPDRAKMLKMATHKAAALVDPPELYSELALALAPFQLVIGTTARQGRQRRPPNHPRAAIKRIIPALAENKVALLFGNEASGLSNEDLKYCHHTSTIPTADFSSLNLAQAVAIHCHELYYSLLYDETEEILTPRLARTVELEGMYEHLEEMLKRVDFLKDNNGRNDYWMNSIRKFIGRLGLQAKEVKMIRGFCRQFIWHQEHRGRNT